MAAQGKFRAYRLRKDGSGGVPRLEPMDSIYYTHVFEVGAEHSNGLEGKRFIARKRGEEVTFQVNEGTKDEPKLRPPNVDELKSGFAALSVKLDTLSRQEEDNHGPSAYASDEQRDRIRALNQVIKVLKRRVYEKVGVHFDPDKREFTLVTDGKTIQARGKEDETAPVVLVQDPGKQEWRPAERHERDMLLRHMGGKLGVLSVLPEEWADPVRVLRDLVAQKPGEPQVMTSYMYSPMEPYLDITNASFRFIESAPGGRGNNDSRIVEAEYLAYGFQMKTDVTRRRDIEAGKQPSEAGRPGFWVGSSAVDLAYTDDPVVMRKIVGKMSEMRLKAANKRLKDPATGIKSPEYNASALSRLDEMVEAAEKSIVELTEGSLDIGYNSFSFREGSEKYFVTPQSSGREGKYEFLVTESGRPQRDAGLDGMEKILAKLGKKQESFPRGSIESRILGQMISAAHERIEELKPG